MSSAQAQNRLLQSIPAPYRRSFVADLRPMDIEAHGRLAKAGARLSAVYFPVGAVISGLYTVHGTVIEVYGIGREGMLGAGVPFATEPRRFDWVCQIAGPMLSMPYTIFERHALRHVAVQQTLSFNASNVLTIMTQTVACNGLHNVDERCACRLLLISDRAGAPEFSVSHELLARVIGVTVPAASQALHRLQELGIVAYRFGRISILDRARLALESCECYALVVRNTKPIRDSASASGTFRA